jgi:AraC-like DNA-binding protein
MGFRATTDPYNGVERLDYWRDVANQAIVPMEPLPGAAEQTLGDFRASITVDRLAAARVATISASGHQVRRTPRLVAAHDEEVYSVLLLASGEVRVAQQERQALLGAGDVVLLDSSDCYELHSEGRHLVESVTFPRAMLPLARKQVARLTGTQLSTRGGAGALLRSFMRPLGEQTHGGQISAEVSFRVLNTMVDLTETLLLERLGQREGLTDAPRQVLLLAVKRDIESRLGTAGLRPGEIAARHHVSLRYLYRLFEAEGVTVAEYVRRRRLARCLRDLRDPALADLPVAAVGARWGLGDAAHFNRAFKAMYAVTPGDYRRGAAAAPR